MTCEAAALAGLQAAPDLELRFGGVVRDAEAEAEMNRAGQSLAAGSACLRNSYTFRLLRSSELNAFSLPGGIVYVTHGLYAKLGTDRLLAAVLAHEMAHIASRDSLRPRSGHPEESLNRELAADARAVDYLNAVGLPSAALTNLVLLIKDTQPPGWAEVRTRALAHRR